MSEGRARDIVWIGSTKRDLRAMPAEIQDAFGYALDLAQRRSRADSARPMSGDLRDVIEIRAHDDTGKNIFRAMYTIKLGQRVYVLHVFQKKSTEGRETPKRELDLIRSRLQKAQEIERQNQS